MERKRGVSTASHRLLSTRNSKIRKRLKRRGVSPCKKNKDRSSKKTNTASAGCSRRKRRAAAQGKEETVEKSGSKKAHPDKSLDNEKNGERN